ncbi:MAG: transglycosylase domain-containing protein [Staphylococcus epidermidis]|nr:transglycosylase domain-containing protein [Staphylococcus epidermidis]
MTENKGSSQPKKNNNNGKSNGKKNRNVKRTIIKIIGFMIIAFFVLLLLGILLFAYYAWKAPAFSESKLDDPIPAKIYDKNGELVKTLDNGQRHEHVNIKDVPKDMKNAVLATEDNRFYQHGALDYKRLFGAIGKNLTGGFGSQGASTLTQQVVKDSFLTQQKSIGRKAQEAYLSYRLEQEYSKDEIFQVYMNKIYYSDGVTGIKAAAKYYFNKDMKDLNLAEEAYLAGLPQVPNLYNIYNNPKEANNRKDTVLYLMHKHNRINDKQYEDAKKIDLKANLVERTKKERQVTGNEKNPEYDSYVNFVQSELMNNKYFKDKNLGSVLQSGIKIYTNMDKDVQQTLQDRINNGSFYKNEDQQVGATILDSKTGGLVAISGGRNYKNVVERNQAVSIYDALRQSFNIPALKTWQQVKSQAGNDAPQKFASKLGLDYSGKIGPSEVLGGSSSEFSPTQLASAFAAIANGGTYNNAHSIQKVVTHEGDTIEYEHTSHKAMKDYTSYMLAEILKGTFKAYGSAYGHGVSGVNMGAKTGTGTYGQEIYEKYNLPDNAAKDIWINGFSPEYTMSVWMGFNKVKQYGTNSFIGHSEQEYPQYLYEDVMSSISSKDGEDFKKPNDVQGSSPDSLSVSGHSDNNTTNRSVHGSSDTSSSSNGGSNSASSGNNSNSSNGTSQGNSGNAFTRLFNLNSIFDYKVS